METLKRYLEFNELDGAIIYAGTENDLLKRWTIDNEVMKLLNT